MKTGLPCFIGKGSRMCMQLLLGSLSPPPREPGTRLLNDQMICIGLPINRTAYNSSSFVYGNERH